MTHKWIFLISWYRWLHHEIVDMIEQQPAADMVEVVRCSKCKHQKDCMEQLVFWERDHVLEQNVYQYYKIDFCSYGERKDGDE